MKVAMHEFKSHLAAYVGLSRAGETIELTSHRKVVARLTGVPKTDSKGLAMLLESEAVSWHGGKPAGAKLQLKQKGTPVSTLVLEDRE